MRERIKAIIPREKWMRGESANGHYEDLARNCACAWGHVAYALGAERGEACTFLGASGAYERLRHAYWTVGDSYDINDGSYEEEDRERKLTAFFACCDIDLEFTGEGRPARHKEGRQ